MALPPGMKKSKNGKKVYSQSARAVKWREEQKVGEFADDAAAAETLQPALVETPPEPFSSPGELSTESIGVVTTDQQGYFCENCKGKISIGDPQCPVCEESLDWSGLR